MIAKILVGLAILVVVLIAVIILQPSGTAAIAASPPDTSLALVSVAPLAKLESHERRMGWDVPWLSFGADFNKELGRLTRRLASVGTLHLVEPSRRVLRTPTIKLMPCQVVPAAPVHEFDPNHSPHQRTARKRLSCTP